MNLNYSSTEYFRSSTAILLGLVLGIGGCTTTEPVSGGLVVGTAEELVSGVERANIEPLMLDPRFTEYSNTLQEMTEEIVTAVDQMSPRERTSFNRSLANVQCSSEACPELASLYARAGIAVNEDVIQLAGLQTRALVEAGYSGSEMVAGVIRISGIDYAFYHTDYQSNADETECIEDCARTYAVLAATALATYVVALAACTAAGPAWPICAAAASWAYGSAVYSAGEAAEACVEDCEDTYGDSGTSNDSGSGSNDGYCSEDSDCDNDEYCDKGVILGIGQNECKPEKEEGDACSRDGQCETGCCKYYWYWWQCRPESKCD